MWAGKVVEIDEGATVVDEGVDGSGHGHEFEMAGTYSRALTQQGTI
jgi:hypothetical protein